MLRGVYKFINSALGSCQWQFAAFEYGVEPPTWRTAKECQSKTCILEALSTPEQLPLLFSMSGCSSLKLQALGFEEPIHHVRMPSK